MTITRQPGTQYITFLCDGSNGCTEELETDFKDIKLAAALMTSEGWAFQIDGSARGHGIVYKHYCEDCKEDHRSYG